MKLSRKLFGSMLVMIVAIALGSLIWWGRQPAPQSSASTGFDVFAQQSGFQAVTPDYHPEYPKDMAAASVKNQRQRAPWCHCANR